MAPVSVSRRVAARSLASIALASVVGCGDAVLESAGLGSLRVQIVLDTTRSVGLQPIQPAVSYATILRVAGPSSRTLSMELVGDFYESTVTDLVPGTYSIVVEGRADGAVDHYGRTDGVTVVAGSPTSAAVLFGSFVPGLTVGSTSPTTFVVVPVVVAAVSGADAYEVQWSTDPAFTNANTVTAPGGVVNVTLGAIGSYYVHARAVSADVTNGRFSPTSSFDLVADVVGTSSGGARFLGFGTAANGTIGQVNILPTGDDDWFGVGVCQGDTIAAETTAARLTPASPLNTILSLQDSSGTLMDRSDDVVLTDSRLVTLAPVDDTLYLVVTGSAGTIGHYELAVDVRPGPRNTGLTCSPP